ncbi:hypothetical protein, partial [Streptomyces sp. NPDC048845]
RNRRSAMVRSTPQGVVAPGSSERAEDTALDCRIEPQALGIPRIIGRRARWVSARLRHPRD